LYLSKLFCNDQIENTVTEKTNMNYFIHNYCFDILGIPIGFEGFFVKKNTSYFREILNKRR